MSDFLESREKIRINLVNKFNEPSEIPSNVEIEIIDCQPQSNISIQDAIVDSLLTEESALAMKPIKTGKNPNNWKQNERKAKRQSGQEYINSKGHKQESRQLVRSVGCRNSTTCNFKCSLLINESERQTINQNFWRLDDAKKNHFYAKFIRVSKTCRKRTKNEKSRRSNSFKYFFELYNDMIQVCQEFFTKTLNINKGRVYYFFKNNQNISVPKTPFKGKFTKKKVLESEVDEVIQHIKQFPIIDSHYCRATSTKSYLDPSLNISRMYHLFKEQHPESTIKFWKYKDIFKQKFNLGFHLPKKDLCDKCELSKLVPNPNETQMIEFETHKNNKIQSKLERDGDLIVCQNNQKIKVFSFDLQNVFQLPKANTSNFFYKRKFCAYNLTGKCFGNLEVYNSIWYESICGREGTHIANALIKMLNRFVTCNPEMKRIIIWSDSCVPQNKNCIMTFALQNFLKNSQSSLQAIEQKFSEAGHGNVHDIDAAHSVIERYFKHKYIYSPIGLVKEFKELPVNKQKFVVLQMQKSDYYDYHTAAYLLNYKKIPFTKVKHLIYEKDSPNIKYRNSFVGEFQTIKILPNKRNTCTWPLVAPLVITTNSLSTDKIKDIKYMLDYMPSVDQHFYRNVISVAQNSRTEAPETTCKAQGRKKK